MSKEQPNALAALHPYIYQSYVARLYTDLSAKNCHITDSKLENITPLLEKFKPDLLVVDAETLTPPPGDKVMADLWSKHSAWFGFYALKEMVEQKLITAEKIHLVTISPPLSYQRILDIIKLPIPLEQVTFVDTQSPENIFASLVQAKLGIAQSI